MQSLLLRRRKSIWKIGNPLWSGTWLSERLSTPVQMGLCLKIIYPNSVLGAPIFRRGFSVVVRVTVKHILSHNRQAALVLLLMCSSKSLGGGARFWVNYTTIFYPISFLALKIGPDMPHRPSNEKGSVARTVSLSGLDISIPSISSFIWFLVMTGCFLCLTSLGCMVSIFVLVASLVSMSCDLLVRLFSCWLWSCRCFVFATGVPSQ